MEENTDRATHQGTSLLMTLLIIGVIVGLVIAGVAMLTKSGTKITATQTMIDETQYTSYDGQTVTGSQVSSLVRQWGNDEIGVVVKTLSAGEIKFYYSLSGLNLSEKSAELGSEVDKSANKKALAAMTQKSENGYINPSAQFEVSVLRNKNDVLVGVYFEQK